MAGVDDKITNGLLVWGNASAAASDMAELTPSQYGTVEGAQGGDLVYGDVLNAGIRSATLLGYAIIQALKAGPAGVAITESASSYSGNWYDGITPPISFDYKVYDTDIASFSADLNKAVNQYLKYSQVYFAVRSNVWNNPRTFRLTDGSHYGTGKSVDGSANVDLPLPSVIDADVTGSASDVTDSVGGVPIDDLLARSSGSYIAKVKSSERSDTLALSDATMPGSATDYPIWFSERGSDSEYKAALRDSGIKVTLPDKTLSAPRIQSPTQYGNFGACSTASSTAAKTASLAGFALAEGAVVEIAFSEGNSASAPTLNVNSTGAFAIKSAGAAIGAGAESSWNAGDVVSFLYSNSAWHMVGPRASKALKVPYAVCDTAVGTLGKQVTYPGFKYENGARLYVLFQNANTMSHATLNVNDGSSWLGAKDIKINGSDTSSSDPYTLWGTNALVEFVYDGTRFHAANWTKNAYYADSAGSAATADNATLAATATLAETANSANKLGNQSKGSKTTPTYFSAGLPLAGYERKAGFGAFSCDHSVREFDPPWSPNSTQYEGSDTVYVTASMTQIDDQGNCLVEADILIDTEAATNTWYRISLDSIVSYTLGVASYTLIHTNAKYIKGVATGKKENLAGYSGSFVFAAYRFSNKVAYAYIGCDEREPGVSPMAHISFIFQK